MATPSVVVFEYELQRITILTRSVTCIFVSLSFFVAPFSLLAVFHSAGAFNQDVSKWNTSAVTTMKFSKYTLFPSLWPRLSLLCILNIRQLSSFIVSSGSHFSHVLLFVFGWSISISKCLTAAVSNEHCAVANGNLCLAETN